MARSEVGNSRTESKPVARPIGSAQSVPVGPMRREAVKRAKSRSCEEKGERQGAGDGCGGWGVMSQRSQCAAVAIAHLHE